MELYQLEYFRALCHYKSYTKTAQIFDVTQPSITAAIKKLEKECYGPLLDRASKKLTVTPLGEALLKHTEIIHSEVEAIKQEMAEMNGKQPEAILLGVPLTLCPDLIQSLSSYFTPAHVNTPLIICQSSAETISAYLDQGLVNIGILCKNMLLPSFEAKLMKSIEFCAFFSEDHEFAHYDCLTPEMLADQPLIISQTPMGVMKNVENYFLANKVPITGPRLGNIMPSIAHTMARSGAGIAFLSKDQFSRLGAGCAPLYPPLNIDLCIAWKRNRSLTASQRDLIRFILGNVCQEQ
jgi:DNA-binding transcriptional LysR family regulator